MPDHPEDQPAASSSAVLRAYPTTAYRPAVRPPMRRRDNVRRGWAVLALLLSMAAVVFEARYHLCASTLFDPLPDALTGVAYAWVLFFLAFNEATLRAAVQPTTNPLILWLGPKRAAGFALAGTSVALLVAAMTTWMFLPFLALTPLLVLSLVGSLLLAPCLDLIVLRMQWRALRGLWQQETADDFDVRATTGTMLLSTAAAFFLIVRPALIGHLTAQALHKTGNAQQEAFNGLRTLRGESAMLDLTYRRNPAYWVCFGYNAGKSGLWPWCGYSWNGIYEDVATARRTYFLMTGTPFESVPRPDSEARQNELGQPDSVAIEETGGYVVGRPIPGLSLDTSAMSFTADAQNETTTGAWTLAFRNDTDAPQEARADILLPPAGTCYQVSLWVNGVERPAAFSAPQKVREAYQQIAVVQHRDPLLVTMPAPDHLLAQCFPVPPHATMQIKLGITAPLTWRSAGDGAIASEHAPRLLWTCPTFGCVNFSIPVRLTHSLVLTTTAGYPIATPTIRGADIFSPPVLRIPSTRTEPCAGDVLAPGVARTESPLSAASQPVDMWLVRDASQGINSLLTAPMQREIERALANLPRGSRVVCEDTDGSKTPAGPARYAGGTDPAPALEKAIRDARTDEEAGQAAVVVFLHAASPANVSDLSGVRHELQYGAAGSGPVLFSIQLAPAAQDAVAMDLAGFSTVYARRVLPGDDGALYDELRYAARAALVHREVARPFAPTDAPSPLGGNRPAVNGIAFQPLVATADDADPLARLCQASQTTAGWYASNATPDPAKSLDLRIAAGAPAARADLVTPISSAVVLETQAQYAENGLKDPDHPDKKPAAAKKAALPDMNSPEPASGVLAAFALCLLLGLRRTSHWMKLREDNAT